MTSIDDNCRILAKGSYISNDTRITGIDNNDLVIGPTGAGKTRNYVKPNIMQFNGSMVIADTKGNLRREVGPLLQEKGFRLLDIDFTDMRKSKSGYNPFDFISYDAQEKKYSERDIMTVSSALIPVLTKRDPFWEMTSQLYLECLISYSLLCLPKNEHNLGTINVLADHIGTKTFSTMLGELAELMPDCFAISRYRQMKSLEASEKTDACVKGFLFAALNPMNFDGARNLFEHRSRINFSLLGKEKTAVFLTISDTDRSMDSLANLFYTQALNILCKTADEYSDSRLPVPVRFFFDDFATNTRIPGFDKVISVIRSREISASIIIQSISQLEGLYGYPESRTIINNCGCQIYLGGQDVDTARYVSIKANKTINTILEMPLDKELLFIRGQKPQLADKYDIKKHPEYAKLPEALSDERSDHAEIQLCA